MPVRLGVDAGLKPYSDIDLLVTALPDISRA
jgi:hypothetical protein